MEGWGNDVAEIDNAVAAIAILVHIVFRFSLSLKYKIELLLVSTWPDVSFDDENEITIKLIRFFMTFNSIDNISAEN